MEKNDSKTPLQKKGPCQESLAVSQEEIYKAWLIHSVPNDKICIHSFNNYLLNAYFLTGTVPSCPPFSAHKLLLSPRSPLSYVIFTSTNAFWQSHGIYFTWAQHVWILTLTVLGDIFQIKVKVYIFELSLREGKHNQQKKSDS